VKKAKDDPPKSPAKGNPFNLYWNRELSSISGPTSCLVLAPTREEAMKGVRDKLSVFDKKLSKEDEGRFTQVRIAPNKGSAIVILADLD
jgi:hypothetical protein